MTEIRVRRVYEGLLPGWHPILVDRLWPRGIKKADLASVSWHKDVAPSTDLRSWFDHDPERFEDFRRRYRDELAGPARPALDELLAEVRGHKQVVLLYSARDTEHNQAVVLAEVLRELG